MSPGHPRSLRGPVLGAIDESTEYCARHGSFHKFRATELSACCTQRRIVWHSPNGCDSETPSLGFATTKEFCRDERLQESSVLSSSERFQVAIMNLRRRRAINGLSPVWSPTFFAHSESGTEGFQSPGGWTSRRGDLHFARIPSLCTLMQNTTVATSPVLHRATSSGVLLPVFRPCQKD